ncbi:MAG: hypothetical protein IT464_13985 [Planctomycetes bacterium]|nr:hypothetical protein [Planctomycetota bacterium]
MVPDYDDDDVVEDYEEVSSSSDVRRVKSAQGGPVQRPSKGVKPSEPVRPPTTAVPQVEDGQPLPSKGKISHKSAKLIWIICIAVSVLGIAAFVLDIAFDAFGRRGTIDDSGNTVANIRPHNLPAKKSAETLTEHQVRARAFAVSAYEKGREMKKSRAYDYIRIAIKKVRLAQKAGMDDRGNDELWIAAWQDWYQTVYALELFRYKWPYNMDNIPMVNSFKHYEGFEEMSEEALKNEDNEREIAAYLIYQELEHEINEVKKGMQQIAKASSMMTSEAVKPARQKWEAARDEQKFEQSDLDDVNRAPRNPDKEPVPY